MNQSHNSADIQAEVDRNYEAFLKALPSILPTRRDRYALMKAGKILGCYSTALDARQVAEAFIKDSIYSIQMVTDSSIDLGYFSHAIAGGASRKFISDSHARQ